MTYIMFPFGTNCENHIGQAATILWNGDNAMIEGGAKWKRSKNSI